MASKFFDSWFILIFISTNLFAITGLFDKFFCAQKFKNSTAYAVAINLLTLIFILGLSFFVNFSYPPGLPLFFAIISGPLYFLTWVWWYQSLKSIEVSRATAVFNIAPIFNTLLAVVFLSETLTNLKWVAIFLIVTGAIISSWEDKKTGGFNRAYILVVFSAMAGAVGNVVSKYAIKEINPLGIYIISFYASLPLYLLFLAKREVFLEVKTSLTKKEVMVALFLRSLIAFVAICLFYLALSSGPISLISAVNGIGPFLIFVYSTIVSLFWPRFIKEELSRQALFSKAAAIILIVTGLALISFS